MLDISKKMTEADFDEEAGYYGHEDEGPWPEAHLAEEFDSAFASYTDARKRFNDLKMARGFLPVVALADQQPLAGMTTPTPSPTSSSWPRKGKGKGGKKGKGKGTSNVIRYPPQGAGKSDPKGRACANMTCLRCGQQGHWAANCPQAASTSPKSSGNKRPAPTEGMASSADTEAALLLFEDQAGNERPDCTMIDPGASAFLTGYAAFRRYLVHLEQDCGFPIDSIAMTKGKRRFQFGGDAAAWSNWSAHLPVFLDGRYGTIQIFLLPGNTPMPCGRPIIEALGMSMDFAMKRIRFGSSAWQDATIGKQGEYLLSLTNEYDLMHFDPQRPDFQLMTAEPDMMQHDGYTLADFEKAEQGFTVRESCNPVEKDSNVLKRHDLNTMDVQLRSL